MITCGGEKLSRTQRMDGLVASAGGSMEAISHGGAPLLAMSARL
jgi:hypothetical protein